MDGLDNVWNNFMDERTRKLFFRYPGLYRAEVSETNDPLNMRRVKFLLPEIHDSDLTADDLPWAVPASDMGGKGHGDFSTPCIGDFVWITFEKGHPYAPVWIPGADPTRRAFYAPEQITLETLVPLDINGDTIDQVVEYNVDYLPKDGRPMSTGTRDRYGNLDLVSAIGFFPKEHDVEPFDPGYDAIQEKEFEVSRQKPEVNSPDLKYMARISKYGHVFVLSDVGYEWKKDGSSGEFTGEFEEDREFEAERWKYLQRLINEDQPGGHDIRKMMFLSRAGHSIELRDTRLE